MKVQVARNNVGSNWRFANSANNARYTLINRNQNVPKILNISSGNLFKQGNLTAPPATQQPSGGAPKTIYEDYPLLNRVKNVLNSVQNSENSTGKAQHRILKVPQKPGMRGRFGPYMNKFNWSKLKNDPRLSAAQKKTVNKIIVSLQVPTRDEFSNRPPIMFNPTGMTIAQVNSKIRAALPNVKTNNNVFHNTKTTFNNPLYNNENLRTASQHRQAFGN